MKPTEQISLGGYAFTIEADALRILENYLEKVSEGSSEDVREELTSDIEERLAELFLEKCPKGTVVDQRVVRESVERIGVPGDDDIDENDAPKREGASSERKQFYRCVDDRVFGGVCSGIARYFGLDVFLVRFIPSLFCLIFMVTGFHGHPVWEVIMLYVLVWIIAPASKTVEQKCRAEGKPLNFSEFKEQAESAKDAIESTAEEAKTAPGFKAFGRFISSCVGIVFTLAGIAILMTCLFGVVTFGSWAPNLCQLITPTVDRAVMTSILYDPLIQWSFVGMTLIFGISMLYSGILMIFDIKSPKWRPGLIFFLVFVALVIFFGLSVGKHMIEIANLWNTV